MPASFQIDTAGRRVLVTLSGEIDDAEILQVVRDLWAHPDHDGAFDRLVDATRVDRVKVTASAVQSIALEWGRKRTGRLAMVGTGEGVYGMLRMYELYADDPVCRAFRTLDEALSWLGDEPQQRPER